MSPNDAYKEENEKEVRHKYIVKYKLKHNDKVKYSVGDFVRIYKYKDIFTKTIGSIFTEEVSKVRKVQKTKPHKYLLEDLNGEEFNGSFYSFEFISVASKNLFILFNCCISSYLFVVLLIDKEVCLSIANRFI